MKKIFTLTFHTSFKQVSQYKLGYLGLQLLFLNEGKAVVR